MFYIFRYILIYIKFMSNNRVCILIKPILHYLSEIWIYWLILISSHIYFTIKISYINNSAILIWPVHLGNYKANLMNSRIHWRIFYKSKWFFEYYIFFLSNHTASRIALNYIKYNPKRHSFNEVWLETDWLGQNNSFFIKKINAL